MIKSGRIPRNVRVAFAKPVAKPVVVDTPTVDNTAKLIAEFGNVKVLPCVGKALNAQKWFQRDYASFTPKGVTLVSSRLRGHHARFATR